MSRYGLLAFAIVCVLGLSLGAPSCEDKDVQDCKAPSCRCWVTRRCVGGKVKIVRNVRKTTGSVTRTSKRWTSIGSCKSSGSKKKSSGSSGSKKKSSGSAPAPSKPKTPTSCSDNRENCNLLKRYCVMTRYKSYMKRKCCKTCADASKAPKVSKKKSGSRKKKTGSGKKKTRSGKKKTRSRKKKTGSGKKKTRSGKKKTRSGKKTNPSPKKKTTSGSLSEENAKCLKDANSYRQKHVGTPNMVWDAELERKAQKWADNLADNNLWLHDPDNHKKGEETGENLWSSNGCCTFKVQSKGTYCESADKAWYNEINYYDYATQKQKTDFKNKMVGHFTQMVWKRSIKVGFGYATKRSANGGLRSVVVAKYSPPGNYPNKKNDVLPLKSKDEKEEETVKDIEEDAEDETVKDIEEDAEDETFKDIEDERNYLKVLEDGIVDEDKVMTSHYVPFSEEADAEEDDAGEPIIEMVK